MAHGNQRGGLLGRLDAGEARDLQRVALGVLGQRGEDRFGELDEGLRDSLAARRFLGADIHHMGTAYRRRTVIASPACRSRPSGRTA